MDSGHVRYELRKRECRRPGDAPTPGWGSGVRLRFFAAGNAGDAFASIVFNGAQQAQADLGVKVDYIFSGWDVNMMTDTSLSSSMASSSCQTDGTVIAILDTTSR